MRLKTEGFEEKLEFNVDPGDTANGLSYVDGRINGTALKVEGSDNGSGGFNSQQYHLTDESMNSSVHNYSFVGRAYISVDGLPTIVAGGSATHDTPIFGFGTGDNMLFGITDDGYWTVADAKGRRRSGPSVPTTNSVTDVEVVPNQWYCLEVGVNRVTIAGVTKNVIVYRIDQNEVSCRTLSGGGISSGIWFARCTASGSSQNPATYVDDFALNDMYGDDQNTWPGPGHVVLCMPSSVSTGGSWVTGTSYDVDSESEGPPPTNDICYTGHDSEEDFYHPRHTPDSGGFNSDKLVAISNVPQRGDDNLAGNPDVGGTTYAWAEDRMLSNPGSIVEKDFFARGPSGSPPPPGCTFGLQYDNVYHTGWKQFVNAEEGDSITAAQDTSLVDGAIAVTIARAWCGRGNTTGDSRFESIFDDHTSGYVDISALGQTVTVDLGSAGAGVGPRTIVAAGATPTDIVITRQTANKFVLNVSAMWTLVECGAEIQSAFNTSCVIASTGPLICFV